MSAAFLSVDLSTLVLAQRQLGAQAQQLPFAVAQALTSTAHGVRRAIQGEMQATIAGGPTAYTLRSFEVLKASKRDLRAEVRLRPDPGGATPYERSIEHLFHGGTRRYKRLEGLLERRGLLPHGAQLAPGRALPLDARGNPRTAALRELVGIVGSRLRNLRSFRRANKKGQQRAVGFFVVLPGEPASRHLAPGIWQRVEHGPQSAVRQWFHFISPPGYRRLFDLRAIADPIVSDQFGRALDASVARALATARP